MDDEGGNGPTSLTQGTPMQYGHCRGKQGALSGALTVEGYRAPMQEEAGVGEEHMLGKAEVSEAAPSWPSGGVCPASRMRMVGRFSGE